MIPRWPGSWSTLLALVVLGQGWLALSFASAQATPPGKDWQAAVAAAAKKPPMTEKEAEAFIARLLDFVEKHHLKTAEKSPQRGMVYEYFDVQRRGEFDQWVQGEALDTMHDGAWLAIALVHAARATGQPRYRRFLTQWQLPFYARMLNHSNTLFKSTPLAVDDKGVRFGREHQLQAPEKGFVPYWWDDGASVSLERRQKGRWKGPPFACTDHFAGKDNPQARLSGYSHGSSNHLAQDLGPMLLLGWLLLRESTDAHEQALARDLVSAAKHLAECRARHGAPTIPAVIGPAGRLQNDASLLAKVSGPNPKLPPNNHYVRLLSDLGGERRHSAAGFADDTQYLYYAMLAKHGAAMPREVRFRIAYDALTEPMLYRFWSDNAPVPAGINRFDLSGFLQGKGGRLESYRSDKTGPIGSRMGPQSLVLCGWAAQMLRAEPDFYDEQVRALFPRLPIVPMTREAEARTKPTALEVKGLKLHLHSQPEALHLSGQLPGETLELQLSLGGHEKAAAAHAVLTLKGDGSLQIRNHRGDALRHEGKIGDKGHFSVTLPYTIRKGQGLWGNGYELSCGRVTHAGATVEFVVASSGAQVRASLERELAGGLRTWEAIFDTLGYLPTGLGAGSWDRFSDSGGYAHLISAASQYLLVQSKRSDAALHAVPRSKDSPR
jgi:hypothetical protein